MKKGPRSGAPLSGGGAGYLSLSRTIRLALTR